VFADEKIPGHFGHFRPAFIFGSHARLGKKLLPLIIKPPTFQ
jgi:hypothetical protein